MKKIYYLLLFMSFIAVKAKSQVTIGSTDAPNPSAVLELKSTNLGFLPPRVKLESLDSPAPLSAHVPGMVVYNLTDDVESLQPGLYYNTGSQWVRLAVSPYSKQNWFYMPSIVFDTSSEGVDFTKNLYEEFKTQLNTSGGLVINSSGAPAKALTIIPAADQLNYYVTAYDTEVFDNIKISADGVMTYDIIGAASDSTYVNIVFVEKEPISE